MKIKRIVVGELETNCYLIENEGEIIVIDPGANTDKIIKEIGPKKVKTILITHYHFDHIGALEELKNYYKTAIDDYRAVDNLEVINTPGHTKDSKTYYFPKDKVMFCGDFLFNGTFGRTDLEGGDNEDMQKSIETIANYPDDIVLYPGHGPKSILKKEKSNFKSYLNYLKNKD